MSTVMAWASVALGIAVLLGVSRAINSWELKLSFGNTEGGGQLFLFILGLMLLIGGIVQVYSQVKSRK